MRPFLLVILSLICVSSCGPDKSQKVPSSQHPSVPEKNINIQQDKDQPSKDKDVDIPDPGCNDGHCCKLFFPQTKVDASVCPLESQVNNGWTLSWGLEHVDQMSGIDLYVAAQGQPFQKLQEINEFARKIPLASLNQRVDFLWVEDEVIKDQTHRQFDQSYPFCFQRYYPDLCFYIKYSIEFIKHYKRGESSKGKVHVCFNQNVFIRSENQPQYDIDLSYEMPICYGPDANQDTRDCLSGAFSTKIPHNNCMIADLKVQAGTYDIFVHAKYKNDSTYRRQKVRKKVICTDCY